MALFIYASLHWWERKGLKHRNKLQTYDNLDTFVMVRFLMFFTTFHPITDTQENMHTKAFKRARTVENRHVGMHCMILPFGWGLKNLIYLSVKLADLKKYREYLKNACTEYAKSFWIFAGIKQETRWYFAHTQLSYLLILKKALI